jgi:bifunctional DNase/RNase
MAVRFDAPIFTTQQVLNEAGILLELEDVSKEEEPFSETVETEDNLKSVSMEELQKLLEDAVKEEDYDTALEIQEEIKRRKKRID